MNSGRSVQFVKWFLKTTWSKGHETLWVKVQRLVAMSIVVMETFLVVEEQDFKCSCLNPPLKSSSHKMQFRNVDIRIYHAMSMSQILVAHVQRIYQKYTEKTFASLSRFIVEKRKKLQIFLQYTQTQ